MANLRRLYISPQKAASLDRLSVNDKSQPFSLFKPLNKTSLSSSVLNRMQRELAFSLRSSDNYRAEVPFSYGNGSNELRKSLKAPSHLSISDPNGNSLISQFVDSNDLTIEISLEDLALNPRDNSGEKKHLPTIAKVNGITTDKTYLQREKRDSANEIYSTRRQQKEFPDIGTKPRWR